MHTRRASSQSDQLYVRALRQIPGGVNSPVRSFKSVARNPMFAARGSGSRIWDVDGNDYIDFVMSYGPLIFGHAPPDVIEEIKRTAELGTTFGASTAAEVEMAELICTMVPSIEKVRLVSSGTEAVMSAVRAARGYTGRAKIVKFAGCYHGHSDSLLAKAGSGVATLSLPDSAGVPENLTRDTIVLPYNDCDSFKAFMRANSSEIAAVLVEPVAANMGVVLPKSGFLEALRSESTRANCVLIFDEIITGFRLARGGAQEHLGIVPDMTTLGKIAGGGLPLAAYGGRAEIMDCIAPVGPVYQAGTLSGNPLAVAAGLVVLRRLNENPAIYPKLAEEMSSLVDAAAHAARRAGVPITANRIGSIATLFFTDAPVTDFASASLADRGRYSQFFAGLYDRGVLVAPSQFEAMFLSTSHSPSDLSRAAEVFAESFAEFAAK